MGNGKIKQPRLAITVIAVAAVMLVAATTEMAITGYAFGYNRNQATGAATDCGNGQEPTNIGCQNSDSQIQGDENSAAITSQQTFPSVTRGEPPTTSEPTGFTIEGKGLLRTDSRNSFTCGGIPFPPGIFVDLRFSARDDSENFNGNFGFLSSGTYSVTISRPGVADKVTEGVLDDEYTLGPLFPIPDSTFTLKGDFHDNVSVCAAGIPVLPTVMISGVCGRDEQIRFEDSGGARATFFGDVDCALTF